MTEINHTDVRPYLKEDYESVIEILLHSFGSKFNNLTRLNKEELKNYATEAAFFDRFPTHGYFVATLNNKVVGVVKCGYTNQKKLKDLEKKSFFYLVKKYGLLNVLKLSFASILLSSNAVPGEYYIEHIAVSESARGHGLGTLLINRVFEEANQLNEIHKVTLYVADSNPGAKKLYEKLGFRTIKKRRSLLMHLFFKNRTWYYMTKNLDKSNTHSLTFQKNWWVGFFGFIGFLYLGRIIDVFNGNESSWILLNGLWFIWFSYFLPIRR